MAYSNILFGKTSGGILVPVRVDSDGHPQVDILSGFASLPAGHVAFNIKTVLEEEKIDLNASAGDNTLAFTTVPAGEIWVIEHVQAFNANTVSTAMTFRVSGLANIIQLDRFISPAANTIFPWAGHVIAQVGDILQVVYNGCTVGDDLTARMSGYQFDAP